MRIRSEQDPSAVVRQVLVERDGGRTGVCCRTLAAAAGGGAAVADHDTVAVRGGGHGGEEDEGSSNAVVMDQLLQPGKSASAAGTAAWNHLLTTKSQRLKDEGMGGSVGHDKAGCGHDGAVARVLHG
jgi:hypothetical protein